MKLKNDWTRLHDSMEANIKGKSELIEKVIADNIKLQAENDKLADFIGLLTTERKGE